MKKTIYALFILIAFSGCEPLGLANPENKLIGTWVHLASGAAAGGGGKVTVNGNVLTINRVNKDPSYDCTFEKNGKCDCFGADKYKVNGPASGGTIVFTSSSTNESVEYKYGITKDLLELFETLEEWKKVDSKITNIDLVHAFEKK